MWSYVEERGRWRSSDVDQEDVWRENWWVLVVVVKMGDGVGWKNVYKKVIYHLSIEPLKRQVLNGLNEANKALTKKIIND